MPKRSVIAFIAGTSWALRFETTMLIRIASPASWAAARPLQQPLPAGPVHPGEHPFPR
jgi:hypothetical protein